MPPRIHLNGCVVAPATDFLVQAATRELTLPNPAYRAAVRGGRSTTGIPTKLRYFTVADGNIILPRESGVARELRKHCQDERLPGSKADFHFKLKMEGAWAYQRQGVDALVKADCGLLHADCGTGKTVMALAAIAKLQRTALIIVHTTELMQQWAGDGIKRIGAIEQALGIPRRDVAVIQGARCDFRGKLIGVAYLQSLSQREYPQEFYDYWGVVISDECVTGDTLVWTELGELPLREIVAGKAMYALSFDGERWSYQRILRRWKSGRRKVLNVCFANGAKLRLTSEHPVLTINGWSRATDLRVGDRVLCPAAVAAEDSCGDKTSVVEPGRDFSLTAHGNLGLIGKLAGGKSKQPLPSASVDVESLCSSLVNQSSENVEKIITTLRDFPGIVVHPVLLSLRSSMNSFLEHCWGTPLFQNLRNVAVIDCVSLTVHVKKNGLLGKPQTFQHFVSNLGKFEIKDSENGVLWDVVLCIPNLASLLQSSGEEHEKLSREPGYLGSLRDRWRGGFVTMVPDDPRWGGYIRSLFEVQSSCCFERDCEISESKLGLTTIEGTKFCASWSPTGDDSKTSFVPMSRNVCGTNFTIVESIEDGIEEDVFDLTVANTHNFVANGVVVHNCHHLGANTWHPVISKFAAVKRYGLTATPIRGDGMHKLIVAHTGGIVHSVEAPKLPVTVVRVDCSVMIPKERYTNVWNNKVNHAKLFTLVATNEQRNKLVLDAVEPALRTGRKVLLISNRIEQLKLFHRVFSAGNFKAGLLIAEVPKEERSRAIRESQVICAIDKYGQEGLDIPSFDTLVLLTPLPGAPPAAALQQIIGRIQRIVPGKKPPIVVDIVDKHCKPFVLWYNQRIRFYQRNGYPVKIMGGSR